MKLAENIIKLALAIGAVVGVIFLVTKYMDALKAWFDKLCPACELEEEFVEDADEETAAEEAVEEAVEEPVEDPAETAPVVEEEVVIEEGTPVAEEIDFAE